MSRPTSSMSGVRKTFCDVVVSSAGGGSRPRKYGICGCMPARREQRRVVVRARDERRRRHAQVALLLEEGEEALAQLGGRPHPGILRTGGRARPTTPRVGVSPPCAGRAELLVELGLAAGGGFLRDGDGVPDVASASGAREAPCETAAASPLTFFTGVVIAIETARTAVSALSGHATRRCRSRRRACRAGRSRGRPSRPPSRAPAGGRARCP